MGACPNVRFWALGQYRLIAHEVSDPGFTKSHGVVAISSGRDRAQTRFDEPSQAKTPPVSSEHRPSNTRGRCAFSGEKIPMADGPARRAATSRM